METVKVFREVILTIACDLYGSRSLWSRCSDTWDTKVNAMTRIGDLTREIELLLGVAGPTRINRYFKNGFFDNDDTLMQCVGSFVIRTYLGQLHVFQNLIERYMNLNEFVAKAEKEKDDKDFNISKQQESVHGVLPQQSSPVLLQTHTLIEGSTSMPVSMLSQIGSGTNKNDLQLSGRRFEILNVEDFNARKFDVLGKKITFKIPEFQNENNDKNINNPIIWLDSCVRDIHSYLISHSSNDRDLVGISIKSKHFQNGSAGMSVRPIKNFNYNDLWNLISKVVQSNEKFELDNTFVMNANFIKMPTGMGARKKKNLTIDVIAKRSIVNINNNDNLCFPRALAVGEVYIEQKNNTNVDIKKLWKAICNSNHKIQKERAEKLMTDANVIVPIDGCGLPEIQKFQENYFTQKGIAIVVFDKQTFGDGNAIIYDARSQLIEVKNCINLLFDVENQHFDLILNLSAACDSYFFCSFCNKSYQHINQHICAKICSCCFVSPPCEITSNKIKCQDCNREFFNNTCFLNHKADGSYKKNNVNLCSLLKICTTCFKLVNKKMTYSHICGVYWCKYCYKNHGFNDLCYIQPILTTNIQQKKYLYIFYDFETRQDTVFNNDANIKLHIPTLCVLQQFCTDCIHIDNLRYWCSMCGVRDFVFKIDPIKQFLDYTVYDRIKTGFQEIICIAHNASGFDAQFILREMIKRSGKNPPSVILNGQSIICLTYGRTKFIDSLNYFHMRLSSLTKAFDLPPSVKKGYFPHFFNTIKNQNYVGPLPEAKFYGPDTMHVNERDAFYQWYNTTIASNYVFDFKREIIDYCRMDVEILRQSCLAFRKIFLEIGNTDPFVNATTIASACSHLFRKNFLKPNTIGIIPPNGYRRADKHSQKAIEWLLYCEREINREIIHAGREREFRLPEGFIVDGYLPSLNENDKGIVFEFQGCYYHGCPKCFKFNRSRQLNNNTRNFADLYESTCAKINKIKSLGYEVCEIWECEFNKLKSENPEIEKYISTHPLIDQIVLNPRDAFLGGRTENFVTYKKVENNQKIKYIDICSLYPYICKRGKFPIGHPRILVGTQCNELTGGNLNNLKNVEGLVKCKILPPRNLYIPVLPVKINKKLLFPLCRSCCEEERQSDCNHDKISEREFSGTWVVDELRKAIEIGYEITKIFIIWQYEMTQYDPSTGEGGLFSEYVNTFLRIKQQASGWPVWCTDDTAKKRYVQEYERDEGIKLIYDEIEKNAGLRAVAKLCLNSFWGKFGQRNNLSQTQIVKNRKELYDLLTDPEKEVGEIIHATEEILYVNWCFREECVTSGHQTNVVIAAYTTAQARLKLYTYLEKLGQRVLYCDTDSCIFLSNNNDEYEPPLGSLLGDMTDELSCFGNGTYIDTFISGGPKFYGYKAIVPPSGKIIESCKVKGISLNYINSSKINFDSIKELLDNYFTLSDTTENLCNKINLQFDSIRRTRTHEVVTRNESKTCSIVLTKRRFISQSVSYPFGYKKCS